MLGLALLTAACREDHGALVSPAPKNAAVYQCAMHPEVARSEPGDCPICRMKLNLSAGRQAPENPSAIAGRAMVELSARRRQMIGMTVAAAAPRELERVIHAVGHVTRGSQLNSTIAEYRTALAAAVALSPTAAQEERWMASSWLESVKMKLRQLGLTEERIQGLSRDGGASGEDQGAMIVCEIYEYEAPMIKAGQFMEIRSRRLPGETFPAKVLRLDMQVTTVTRTVRVYGALLRGADKLARSATPTELEQDLDADIRIPLGRWLSVPSEAVLDRGLGSFVFIAGPEDRLEPRPVRVGPKGDGYTAVIAGLKEGEKVATSAHFLIDSESQFRAAARSFQ